MSDIDPPECPECHCYVDPHSPFTISVTRRLVPPDVDYYHGRCHNPWSETEFERKAAEDRAAMAISPPSDPVNAPSHYRQLPSGIEVIEITENFDFLIGNVLKYVLRAEYKGKPLEDWKKARWYLDRAIKKRERDNGNSGR